MKDPESRGLSGLQAIAIIGITFLLCMASTPVVVGLSGIIPVGTGASDIWTYPVRTLTNLDNTRAGYIDSIPDIKAVTDDIIHLSTYTLNAHNIVQANPVQNTWYTVTNQTGKHYKPLACDVQVGLANEDLEFKVTIDGWVIVGTQTPATFASNYRLYIAFDKSSIYLNSGTGIIGLCYYTTQIECHQFIFQVRKTTANGAGNLNALAIWEYR